MKCMCINKCCPKDNDLPRSLNKHYFTKVIFAEFKVGEIYEFSPYNGFTDFVVKPTKDWTGFGYGFTDIEFFKFFSIIAATREETLDKILNS